MTHAPLPWSTKTIPLPQPAATALLDQNGDEVAYFRDHRNAEFVLDLFVHVKELEEQIADLEATDEDHTAHIKALLEEIAELKQTKCQPKPSP